MERHGKVLDPDKAAEAMLPYVEAGFTTFDMADHYGSSEVMAGTFKRKYPELKTQMLTKWVPAPGTSKPTDVREAVTKALTRMQTQQLDLLQFHAWNYSDPRWLDCLFHLQQLKHEGLIAELGVTNFDTAHLRIAVACGIDIVTNQICYSLLDQRAAGKLTAFCLEKNIKLLAFGTLAGGFLSERWVDQPEPAIDESLTWSQMKYKRFIDQTGGWQRYQVLLRTLQPLAAAHGVGIACIASKFIMQQPAVAAVIIGARLGESEHITENRKLFEVMLSEEQMQSIREALNHLQPLPGDCGDEYRKPPYLTASGDLSHHLKDMPAPYEVVDDRAQQKQKVLSGTTWESMAGYCRAVKTGNRVFVSGTTAAHGPIAIAVGDIAAQTHFVIDKIEGALQSVGASLSHVVRTRVYVSDIAQWEQVARAHGERFRDIQPANTMVRAELIGTEYLVEIEAEAVVPG